MQTSRDLWKLPCVFETTSQVNAKECLRTSINTCEEPTRNSQNNSAVFRCISKGKGFYFKTVEHANKLI
ncbi:Hypothetical predicted protein [Paramuricea clavata]|uniref:Uncharacterized protein n=1 Tax=Paramuricea clavata TaxID=317549 RepID=A0A6S7JY88_PARCT|nr:Hypothetical predicted protein [Paramuricea clavata]